MLHRAYTKYSFDISGQEEELVYVILQLGANVLHATTVIAIVNVYIPLTLCQGPSSLLYLSHSILTPSL